MAKLRQVDFAAVAPFKSAAARDRVSVSPTRDTFWFLYEDGPQIIGICALMRTTLGGRIKGVWVDPAHRGRGHGRQMTVDLIALAVDQMFFRFSFEGWLTVADRALGHRVPMRVNVRVASDSALRRCPFNVRISLASRPPRVI